MAEEGIEQVLILPFNDEVAQLSPEAFVERILVGKLSVRAVARRRQFPLRPPAGGQYPVA